MPEASSLVSKGDTEKQFAAAKTAKMEKDQEFIAAKVARDQELAAAAHDQQAADAAAWQLAHGQQLTAASPAEMQQFRQPADVQAAETQQFEQPGAKHGFGWWGNREPPAAQDSSLLSEEDAAERAYYDAKVEAGQAAWKEWEAKVLKEKAEYKQWQIDKAQWDRGEEERKANKQLKQAAEEQAEKQEKARKWAAEEQAAQQKKAFKSQMSAPQQKKWGPNLWGDTPHESLQASTTVRGSWHQLLYGDTPHESVQATYTPGGSLQAPDSSKMMPSSPRKDDAELARDRLQQAYGGFASWGGNKQGDKANADKMRWQDSAGWQMSELSPEPGTFVSGQANALSPEKAAYDPRWQASKSSPSIT